MPKRHCPRPWDFHLGWICAINIEYIAARNILDEEYEPLEEAKSFVLGRISGHDVVISCLPAGQYGTNAAAALAAEMKAVFPNIHAGLVVGVAGGVPTTDADIRLGHVVISLPQGANNGVVQYDFIKAVNGEQQPNISLNAPPVALLKAVAALRSDPNANTKIHAQMATFRHLKQFQRPTDPDVLFKSDYLHIGGASCAQCLVDEGKIITRDQERYGEFALHYGLVGSGNSLVKDAALRDSLSHQYGGINCFETEAAGAMHVFPCLVVRGICDYADSHKNKKWQPYAAAVAASCTKHLLSLLPSRHSSNKSRGERDASESLVQSNPDDLDETEGREHDSLDKSGRCQHELDLSRHVLKRKASCDASRDEVTATKSGRQPFLQTHPSLDENKRYMKSLGFDRMGFRYYAIDSAHPETCSWLPLEREFQEWLTDEKLPEHHGFLWIKGNPGTGKSTIMKYLLGAIPKVQFRQSPVDTVVLKFFFNARGADMEKNTVGMYRSLLFDLLTQLPDLQRIFALRPPGVSRGDGYVWDTKTLQELFQLALGMVGTQSIICLVDALDECDVKQAREMVEFFESLGDLAVDSQLLFRTCFSSRHYPHITLGHGLEVTLEHQEGHDVDIEKFINSKLRIPRNKLGNEIRQEVAHKSCGIFLWVVLVVRILNEDSDNGDIPRLKKRLGELPAGLHELFQDMLSRDTRNMDNFRLCLQWLLFATQPLTPEELYYAIRAGNAVDLVTPWDPEEIDMSSIRLFLISSSKGLAEFAESEWETTVQLIHESVRDYLLKENGIQTLIGSDKNFEGNSHQRLRDCCQTYISKYFLQLRSLEEYSSIPGNSMDPHQSLNEKFNFPFIKYAAQNLLTHANLAAAHGLAQDEFVDTFPLQDWTGLSNFLERDDFPPYTYYPPLLYILANEKAACLIIIALKNGQRIDMHTKERYHIPLISALASGDKDTIDAFVNPIEPYDALNDPSLALHTKLVRTLLTEELDVLGGMTILHWAVKRENSELCRTLLEVTREANLNISGLAQTITYAIRESPDEVVNVLLQSGKVDTEYQTLLPTLHLHDVVYYGLGKFVKDLLDRGADVNAHSGRYGSPLQVACERGNRAVVKLLLANGAEVNAEGGVYGSPLRAACWRGDRTVVELLLANGAEVNAKSGQYGSPLRAACWRGDRAVVELLLANGAEVNAEDGVYGDNALNTIRSSKRIRGSKRREIVKVLLDAGAREEDY